MRQGKGSATGGVPIGRYIGIPILFVAVIIQSTIMPVVQVAGGKPDLVLLIVLSWMMLAGLEEGLFWAIVGGVLQDIATGTPTGTTALALVVVTGLEHFILGPIGRDNLILPPAVATLGTIFYQGFLAVVLAVLGRLSVLTGPADIGYVLTTILLPTLIFNLILILPIFRVLGFAFAWTRPRRVSL